MGKAIRAIPRRVPKAYRRSEKAEWIYYREPEAASRVKRRNEVYLDEEYRPNALIAHSKQEKKHRWVPILLIMLLLLNQYIVEDLTPGNI